MGGATEKDWPKRPSDHQLQEAHKKGQSSCSGGSPCPCTLCTTRVPASQAAVPPSCRAATGNKKNLESVLTGLLRSCPTRSNPVDCGLLGFSVRGVLQARILGRTGQYWLPYPSRTLLFSAAVAANTPEYLVWPEPLQPKQLHHLHTWPSQGQTQALQGSLRSNPQWTTHMQRWK